MSESQDPRERGKILSDPTEALRLDLARQQAIAMRLEKLTYREIAQRMGVALSTAHDYVNDGWARLNQDTDELRQVLRCIEDERIEELLAAVMPLATNPEIFVKRIQGGIEVEEKEVKVFLVAQRNVLLMSKRKASMFGLDAPKKLEVTKGKSSIEPIAALRARVAVIKERRIRKVAEARN